MDVCASFGSFKTILNTLAMGEVMSQVNEIMAYVDVDTWIPASAKSILSTRLTGFRGRTFIDTNGDIDHNRVLTEKMGLSLPQSAAILENLKKNISSFGSLVFGMDPRCQSCSSDLHSDFTVY